MSKKRATSTDMPKQLKEDHSEKMFHKLKTELAASRKELEFIHDKLITINEELDSRPKGLKNALHYSSAVLNIINEPVAELDGALCLVKGNDSFYKTFGLIKSGSRGRPIYELLGNHTDIPNWEQLKIQDNMAHHRIYEFTIIHRFPHLEERVIKIKAQYLTDSTHPEQRILIAAERLLDRNTTEGFSKEDEGAFEIMADNAPVMIWVSDTTKKRIYFNKAWLRYTGRTLEEEKGHGWESGIHPDDLERSIKIFNKAFEKRESYIKEYRLKRKNGEYRWILSQGVPFFKNGLFSGYIGSCVDINYRVEQELQKDELLSVISHELKTPLTTIEVYTDLLHQLLTKDENYELAEFTRKIDVQINKLILLIKEILDISRINGKTLFLNKELLNINKLVEEIIEEKQPVIKSHQLVSCLCPVKEILGDKLRLMQVLDNIISNAVKYSPEAKKINISTEQEDGWVTVSVQDEGIGIPSTDRKKIFDRFFRSPESSRTFPGIGLGLYISNEIVKRHKGKITVEGNAGKGSTFKISFPHAMHEYQQ